MPSQKEETDKLLLHKEVATAGMVFITRDFPIALPCF
jgi:hypothetical protein